MTSSMPLLPSRPFRRQRGVRRWARRAKPGAAAFLANQEKEILRLEHEFRRGRYRPGRYRTMEIFDPKHRLVSAAPFRDRVVHHAFCMVCEPVFEHGFIHDSYANRKGKGTHRAVARYERFGDRFRYVLRGGGPASKGANSPTSRADGTLTSAPGPYSPSRAPSRPRNIPSLSGEAGRLAHRTARRKFECDAAEGR